MTSHSTWAVGWRGRAYAAVRLLLVTTVVGTAGCSDGEEGRDRAAAAPQVSWPTLSCDPLVPSYCSFPYPSNVFTRKDSDSETGLRLALSGQLASGPDQTESLPSVVADRDGFSPGSALLAELPGATVEGLPTPLDIEASLAVDSPTVLLDTETGQRVPHFSEVDVSGADPNPDQRSLMIRPAVRLEDARRYIVAIRRVRSESGVIPASKAFAALRDNLESNEPSVASRRGLYEDIFQRLSAADVERSSLQLAWDFTTASRENTTGWLLHMRDQALTQAGESGPAYVIDEVETDPDADIAFKLQGRMTAPLYLDQPGPGARLVFGEDGLPKVNANRPSYDVPFELMIPKSAKTEPAKLLQYGHGLFGSKSQIGAGHFRRFMNQYGYAMFGADLAGMSGAESSEGEATDDPGFVIQVLSSGEFHRIQGMFDRLHQGALNYLLLMRMVKNGLAKDATYGQYLDASQRYYHGISQGGIFGGVYMATSTDVERGVLGVMGQPYGLLLSRSVDFTPFFFFLSLSFPDARDQQLLLNAVQLLWDRVEPNGYTKHIENDPLPGTPKHSVLMRAAVGDHQVTTLGAHLMARAVGATHLESGVRKVYGLPAQEAAFTGSAYVEYDFGLPAEPLCNVPMRACDDPHGSIRDLPAAEKQLDLFLRTGEAKNFCADGQCRFPDLSGCKAPYVDPCAERY